MFFVCIESCILGNIATTPVEHILTWSSPCETHNFIKVFISKGSCVSCFTLKVPADPPSPTSHPSHPHSLLSLLPPVKLQEVAGEARSVSRIPSICCRRPPSRALPLPGSRLQWWTPTTIGVWERRRVTPSAPWKLPRIEPDQVSPVDPRMTRASLHLWSTSRLSAQPPMQRSWHLVPCVLTLFCYHASRAMR